MSKTQQGQSFIDKVIQQTGTLENVVEMAVSNNVSITDDVTIGSEFNNAGKIQQRIVSAMAKRSAPATELEKETSAAVEDFGIGTMEIESTFKVH